MIRAKELVDKFCEAANGNWGYIYGMTHEMWSAEKQKAYEKQWAGDPDRQNSVRYGMKWAGHWVTDCSGLFKWAFSQLGGIIAHGSNSIWDKWCSAKGTLKNGRKADGGELMPGTAVFTSSGDRHNHIGLYIGSGMVIEAQGAQAGVVRGYVSNRKWTHWGELRGVYYDVDKADEGGKTMTAMVVLPTGASGNTVNMRSGASTTSGLIDRVPVGATVEVLDDQGTWCRIGYNGLVGWMMSNYLEYTGQGGESGGDTVTAAERLTIETALNEIEQQVETIRSALGRG